MAPWEAPVHPGRKGLVVRAHVDGWGVCFSVLEDRCRHSPYLEEFPGVVGMRCLRVDGVESWATRYVS